MIGHAQSDRKLCAQNTFHVNSKSLGLMLHRTCCTGHDVAQDMYDCLHTIIAELPVLRTLLTALTLILRICCLMNTFVAPVPSKGNIFESE